MSMNPSYAGSSFDNRGGGLLLYPQGAVHDPSGDTTTPLTNTEEHGNANEPGSLSQLPKTLDHDSSIQPPSSPHCNDVSMRTASRSEYADGSAPDMPFASPSQSSNTSPRTRSGKRGNNGSPSRHQDHVLVSSRRAPASLGHNSSRVVSQAPSFEIYSNGSEFEKEKQELEIKLAKAETELEAMKARLAEVKAEADARVARAEAREEKVKAEAEAREEKVKAEAEVREERVKAEAEAREEKVKAEAEAREEKVKAEAEAREVKVKAEVEAREEKVKAEAEAREVKVKAEVEARVAEAQTHAKEAVKEANARAESILERLLAMVQPKSP